jgi:hypothetical protein
MALKDHYKIHRTTTVSAALYAELNSEIKKYRYFKYLEYNY